MSKQKTTPELINLSSDNLEEIKTRLMANVLNDADKKIILGILSTYQWLYQKLQMAKFSLHKLKAVFGFTTEKKRNLKAAEIPENLATLPSHSTDTKNSAGSPTTSNDREPLSKKQ